MKGHEDCVTCNSQTFCYILRFSTATDHIHHINLCPCRECLIKPICSTNCEDRKSLLKICLTITTTKGT
jgi:hypothetical protein